MLDGIRDFLQAWQDALTVAADFHFTWENSKFDYWIRNSGLAFCTLNLAPNSIGLGSGVIPCHVTRTSTPFSSVQSSIKLEQYLFPRSDDSLMSCHKDTLGIASP